MGYLYLFLSVIRKTGVHLYTWFTATCFLGLYRIRVITSSYNRFVVLAFPCLMCIKRSNGKLTFSSTCVSVSIYIYVYIHYHIYMYTCIFMRIIYIYIYMYICIQYVYLYITLFVYIYIHINSTYCGQDHPNDPLLVFEGSRGLASASSPGWDLWDLWGALVMS